MSKELIISSKVSGVEIAVTDEGKLVEFQKQSQQNDYAVGDVYLGKVKKAMHGLNSCFVDIGHEKEAFLHYNDLGPQLLSYLRLVKQVASKTKKTSTLERFKREQEIDKFGKISEKLPSGTEVMVQIMKEAISTKGPRVTTEISIPSRYLVLVPFSDKVVISQKIRRRGERERLRKILSSVCPKNFGLIVRTNAENVAIEEFEKDLNILIGKWDSLFSKLRENKLRSKLLSEEDRAAGIIRDEFNSSYSAIVVDDENLYLEIKNSLNLIAPDRVKILKLYNGRKVPIFEKYGVDRQIKTSFGRIVPMTKGAYLVIEHTEAMHVIDVNSGNRVYARDDQEANSMEVNLLAAKEISRQLRLRDMGGIIIIDFIDLLKNDNRKILADKMQEFMHDDKAKHKILPISKFGLMQITRQRVRKQTDIKTDEPNPDGGKQNISAPINVVSEIEEAIQNLKIKGFVTLHCHPFVCSYLTKGFPSQRLKWELKYKRRIKIVSRDAFQFLNYKFYDRHQKIIKI